MIKDNPNNPIRNPNHTCRGLWRLSCNLDVSNSPPALIAGIRYHSSEVYILKERINTMAISAPAPTE